MSQVSVCRGRLLTSELKRWPWDGGARKNVTLQQRIGLIQIACADKIGLFHIGLHPGTTVQDILAPSLRKIIESPAIIKTGVSVLNADFARLQKYFNLSPRGAFELSHLHNLVTYGADATTRLRKLSAQVEEHLGLPLCKGSVRTSNWSRPLDARQIRYAAADVYAGYMLFHCLNAKRAAMTPMPPLPVHAELYKALGRNGLDALDPINTLRLASTNGHVSSWAFFQKTVPAVDQRHIDEDEQQNGDLNGLSTTLAQKPAVTSGVVVHVEEETVHLVDIGQGGKKTISGKCEPISPSKAQTQVHAQRDSRTPDSASAEALFQLLRAHRRSAARETRQPVYRTGITDKLLREMSQAYPRSHDELLQIKGIGKFKAKTYGDDWLAIIAAFLQVNAAQKPETQDSPGSAEVVPLPNLPALTRRRRSRGSDGFGSSPGNRTRTPAGLHTGLSFMMDNISLAQEETMACVVAAEGSEPSDASSAFGSPVRSPSPASLKRKRKARENFAEDQLPRTRRMRVHERRVSASSRTVLAATAATGMRQAKAQSTASPLPDDTERVPVTKKDSSRPASPKEKKPSPKVPSGIALPETQNDTSATRATEQGDRVFRNKLIAFNKIITPVIVLSDTTIELVVKNPPKTMKELIQIPGLLPFANACARKQKSLLKFIQKADSKRAKGA